MTGIRRMTGIAGMDSATEKQRRETQNRTTGWTGWRNISLQGTCFRWRFCRRNPRRDGWSVWRINGARRRKRYARFSDFSKAEGSLINKRRGSIKKRDLRESKTSFFYFCKRKSPCKRKGKKRMTGIEPASKAWEAFILPMNYIRTDLFVTKSLYSELLLM